MSSGVVEHCPQCGSGKIDVGELIGDTFEVRCLNCGWLGTQCELVTSVAGLVEPVSSILGSPDLSLSVAQNVAEAYLIQLSRGAAKEIGLAMIESGVIGRNQPKELTRLIRAACYGAHAATLREIEQIQKELQDARRGTDN